MRTPHLQLTFNFCHSNVGVNDEIIRLIVVLAGSRCQKCSDSPLTSSADTDHGWQLKHWWHTVPLSTYAKTVFAVVMGDQAQEGTLLWTPESSQQAILFSELLAHVLVCEHKKRVIPTGRVGQQ